MHGKGRGHAALAQPGLNLPSLLWKPLVSLPVTRADVTEIFGALDQKLCEIETLEVGVGPVGTKAALDKLQDMAEVGGAWRHAGGCRVTPGGCAAQSVIELLGAASFGPGGVSAESVSFSNRAEFTQRCVAAYATGFTPALTGARPRPRSRDRVR